MSHHDPDAAGHGSVTSYVVGFALSVALTFAAYLVVDNHVFDNDIIVGVIISLAAVQLLVQLVFFLHLGSESGPRWNLTTFTFMLLVLGILVFGSLWIMKNLDYHMMMSPHETDEFIIKDEIIER